MIPGLRLAAWCCMASVPPAADRFSSTEYPERPSKTPITDLKDAKRVLGILTQTGCDAESRFVSASWDDLARRGARCGLSRFLYEVRDCIHALFVQI